MSQLKWEYHNITTSLDVQRSQRRTLSLIVQSTGGVVVKAPLALTDAQLLAAVQTKAGWLLKKLALTAQRQAQHYEHLGVSGEQYLYLGRAYQLEVQVEPGLRKDEVTVVDYRLVVKVRHQQPAVVKAVLRQWYYAQAHEEVGARVVYYQESFSQQPTRIQVKEQKRRWGSCTAQNALLFNWRLVMAPPAVLDYVVIHELCHLRYKNHGREFWQAVAELLPDYQVQQIWLRDNAHNMDV
ncbi:MAG: SprT family zinc-dependent metalloprotease [Acidaminococcaceae bacterium]